MESHQGRPGIGMKLFVLVVVLGASAACRAPERGRYEMETVMATGPMVHLCDTWTGQVWVYSHGNHWEPLAALESTDEQD
jgi:hypothetical protein